MDGRLVSMATDAQVSVGQTHCTQAKEHVLYCSETWSSLVSMAADTAITFSQIRPRAAYCLESGASPFLNRFASTSEYLLRSSDWLGCLARRTGG